MNQQPFTPDTIQRAQDLIARFRAIHETDVRSLDFITSTYLSGNGNKVLRQAVVFCITNEIKPASKCTQFAVSDCLKGAISQPQLF